MKKFIVLFLLLCLANVANAYVDSQYLKQEQFLVNSGYSSEMARMIRINSEDPYREQYKESYNIKNIARRVYNYIVPGQSTDLDFYNHDTSLNGWSWKDF